MGTADRNDYDAGPELHYGARPAYWMALAAAVFGAVLLIAGGAL